MFRETRSLARLFLYARWVLEPLQPLDDAERFRPEFCPWDDCDAHRGPGFRYHCHGSFKRKLDPRPVPRFRCLSCQATFSRQTFATDYYLKRPELSEPVAAQLQAGSAHRQIARTIHCAPSTVTRRSERLGRHALLLQALAVERLETIDEPVVYDHFETFAFSQDLPFGVGTATGGRSWFIYSMDFALHARGGRVSPSQARRRRYSHAERGAYREACTATLDLLARKLPPQPGQLTLISDRHRGYRGALARHPLRHRFDHRAYANPHRAHKRAPSTPLSRLRDGALRANDILHMILRHSHAHHRRETIAFGRRVNALLERAFLGAVWKNFVKLQREKKPRGPTAAMAAGLTRTRWSWPQVLARRLFPSRVDVPETWMRVYRREILTEAIGKNRLHRLVNAF